MTSPTDIQIVDSSPQAALEPELLPSNRFRYPWDTTPVGKSFVLDRYTANLKSLRESVRRINARGDMKYRIVKHETPFVVELARVA